jgi:hypothetical protein
MISVTELQKDQDNRNDIKKKTYEKILVDLTRIVKNRAQLGQKECFLNVPAFVIGKPLYSVRQATKYVIHKMRHNGFEVYDGGGNEIYVSWRVNKEKKASKSKVPEYDDDDDEFMLPSFANLKKSANRVRSLKGTKR